jgi:ATP-dependent DNA helicase RecG
VDSFSLLPIQLPAMTAPAPLSEPSTAHETLRTPIEKLDGITKPRAAELHRLGVHTLGDLLEYFPRTYRLESEELPISQLVDGNMQMARGEVVAVDYISSHPRPRFEATLDDGTGKLSLVWFRAAYLRKSIHPGKIMRVRGMVKIYRQIPQMAHPKWETVDDSTEKIEDSRFRPIYPASVKLPTEVIGKIVEQHLPSALEQVHEWFDESLRIKRGLISRRDAFRIIHQPASDAEAASARRRLIYDELMLMQLGLGLGKRLRDGRLTAPVLRADKLLDERIRKRFPFELTHAQQKVIWEILHDVKSGTPMNRLLQGDVGSGKTAVALYAMLVAVANKLQCAILAPTEVLAEQHYLTLSNLLQDSSVSIELFTARTKRQSRGSLLKHLGDGRIHLAVGTQALVQEDIEFANLGLVVVDEQHRLGVRQRAMLKSKGLSPHYLVMTATPIPRTLALSYFADFDVSTIDHLPPGRQPIKTRWLKNNQAPMAYAFIRDEISAGRQAYIVLPMIDDTGIDNAKSVTQEFVKLSKDALKGLRLAMLHGQMSTDEKQATMNEFRDRKIDVLVATTVIEVGIDVPNASIILIGDADRFGLSQLHQLRGRVGRGKELSHCILLADASNEATAARLKAMTSTTSGFDIAEMDLQLRGPGEFFGTRQHGLPEFKIADITQEMELLHLAKEDALAILEADPRLRDLQHARLRDALKAQLGDSLQLAQIG